MAERIFRKHKPEYPESVWIDPSATVIGNVVLGENVSIWPQAVIRGDVNSIRIGASTNIQDGAVLHCTHDSPYMPGGFPLEIGERATIGHRACLHGCKIGDDVLVGIGSILLDGVVVENQVMIGAGTLVPPRATLTSGNLYLGIPAKKVRCLTNKEKEALTYSAIHYVSLASDHKHTSTTI